MKKLVSILIAGSMAAAICPCTGFAAEGESTAATTTGSFTYAENFDTPSDGVPAGWTWYTNDTDLTKTTCNVSNGALNFSSTSWYGKQWLLFDVESVARNGLTMECDITHAADITNSNRVNSQVGLAYAVSVGEDNTVTGNYAAIRTDVANPDNQLCYISETVGSLTSVNSTADNTAGGAAVDAINKTAGTTMNLKITFNNDTQTPILYLNGKQITYTRYTNNNRGKIGKIGLYLCNANVKIDNFKVTGTGTYPDVTTYKAAFGSSADKYESVEAAKNDVVVSAYDYFGNLKQDVTADATITATDNGDGTGTINVTYGTYTENLPFNYRSKESRGFVYEENFDNITDGTLPTGWTWYTNDADLTKTTCNVSNGALNFSSTSWYGKQWLLFDVESVARNGLTMECDITHAADITNSNRVNSQVGLAYAVSVGEDSTVTGNYAAIRTDVVNPDNQLCYISETVSSNLTSVNSTADNTAGGAAVDAINKTAGTTMHLKITFNNDTQTPILYLNGKQITYTRYSNNNRDKIGKIGLYLCNANVKIDNVKITGTKSDFAPDANSLAISNVKYDSANSKLSVTADAKLTAAAESTNSAIIAAVFDNSDRLVSASTVSVDASKVVDYHGTIAINGVDAAPAAGKVKLFFWDMAEINPFSQYDVQ